jgi:tetratricopeptide (TPR) repeat protein
MRVLPGAVSAEARRCIGGDERQPRMRLRESARGRSLPALSIVLGALAGGGYAHLMLRTHQWPTYVACAIGGACALYLLLVVPQLTWVVVRRQWLQFALRLNHTRRERLLSRAYAALVRSRDGPSPTSEEDRSDLAIIDFLRGSHDAAVEALRRLYQENESPATGANLLAVLTATEQWQDVSWLVDRELDRPGRLADLSTAPVAANAPYGMLLERLWVVSQEGTLPQTLNNIGVRLLQLGDFIRAEDAFSVVKQRNPSHALAYANAGVLAYRREEFGQAVAEAGSAVALEPGEALIYSNLGAALCRTGNLRLARRWLRRAQSMLPGSGDVVVNLGNCHAVEGAYREALETYTQAGRVETVAAAHHNAALMLCARDNVEAALEQQQLAQEAAPDEPDVLRNLGCLLWLQGQYDKARECFQHPGHSSYDTATRSNLIRTELGAGRPQRALELLLQVSYAEEEMDFDRGLAHLITAAQARREGHGAQEGIRERDLVEAVAHFHEVVKADRAAVTEACINVGISYYLSEEYEDAAEAFITASARAPSHEALAYAIAVCYLQEAGRIQRPEGDVYGPPVPRARELLVKAQPYLTKVLGVKAMADNARFNLGVLYYLLEEYDKAETVLRPIARHDSPWQILNVLGIAQARQARELQRSIQSTVLLRVTRKRQTETNIARLLSAAIHSFTQVLRHQPQNVIAHANIGLAQYLRNRGDDVEQALQHWRRMRDIGGAWGQRVFEMFSGAMGTQAAAKLTFQDVEVSFWPLPIEDWIVCAPPRLAGLQYRVRELMDLPLPHLHAHNRLLRRALACRDREEQLDKALRRLKA